MGIIPFQRQEKQSLFNENDWKEKNQHRFALRIKTKDQDNLTLKIFALIEKKNLITKSIKKL